MKNWIKVRGTARVLEKDGKIYLRFPKSVITLFDFRSGDKIRFSRIWGKEGYLVTFRRRVKQLLPLKV